MILSFRSNGFTNGNRGFYVQITKLNEMDYCRDTDPSNFSSLKQNPLQSRCVGSNSTFCSVVKVCPFLKILCRKKLYSFM